MDEVTNIFQYDPLDEDEDSLRLLILHPAGQDIHCTLEHRTFASKPAYETLSYTWGTAPAIKTVVVNGRPFLVRQNLYDALSHAQRATQRAIWVDAICINQANIHERNYQVSLMSFIYMRASRVLVWLNIKLYEPMKNWTEDPEVRLRMALYQEQTRAAIAGHPYWTRVWIIQELVLPKEVQILMNEFTLSEEAFYRASNSIRDNIFTEKIKTIRKHRESRHTETFRLEQLIRTFQRLDCTEKRDKIFGFLGLAHDSEIEVDYGIRYFDLYSKLMDFHQDAVPERDDWRTSRESDRAAKLMHFSELIQSVLEGAVDQDRQRSSKLGSVSKIFTARGATVSRILYLGPTHSEMLSSMSAEKAWRQARQTHYRSYHYLPYSLEADRRYTRSILDWDQLRIDSIRGVGATESHGYKFVPCDDTLAIHAAYTKISVSSQPRQFLGTRGCFGMAPAEARVGDAIACFLDCESYVILRQLDADRWMIVGKASAMAVGERGRSEFEPIQAVRSDIKQVKNSWHGKMPWDKGEGEFDGDRNMINLQLDIYTLQQLTC